ncbi:MAG: PAS domain S-box protein [Nitrospinae bacterium]|nr:PAS domain S-box protein [Nitrospinota bacterium]
MSALVAGIAAILAGAWFYRAEHERVERRARDELSAVAQLKVNQIANWRFERLGDAGVIAETPFYRESVPRYLASPDEAIAGQILSRFKSLHAHYQYFDVLLVDAAGTVRLSFLGGVNPIHHSEAREVEEAFRARRPVLSDIHGDATKGNLSPHIDAIAPFFAPGGEPAGAIVLQSNARDFLYPLIQYWPTPSQSAETLLVRREGDSVLYLNDLRWQKDTALNLRIPLSRVDLPAVMAVMGIQGIVRGRDYRGVEVLAALEPVPETPWFMAAKVDAEEVFAEWRKHASLILALTALIVSFVAAAAMLVWRRKRETERFTAELQKLADIIENAQWGVAIAGPDGQNLLMVNSAYARMHGYTKEEILRLPLGGLYPPSRREELAGHAAKVRELGHHVFETEHIRKDGSVFPIQLSVSAIRDVKGAIRFFAGNAEDITERKQREKEHLLLASVTQSMDDAVVALTLDGVINTWNHGAERLFGYSRQEAVGEPVGILIPPHRMREARAVLEKTRRGEHVPTFETERLRKDGMIVPVSMTISPVTDASGAVIMTCATVRDITERKKAEEAVHESEAKFRALFDQAADAIWLIDPATGALLDFNTAAHTSLGYTRAQFARITIADVEAVESAEDVARHVQKIMKTGSDTFETKHRTRTGELRDILVSAAVITIGGRTFIQSIQRDITARKRAEEALRRTQFVVDSTSDGVYWVGPDGRILSVNDAVCKSLGYTRDELLTLTVSDISPDFPPEIWKRHWDSVRERRSFSVETRGRTKDGRIFPVEVMINYVQFDDKEYNCAFVRDISERKQAEEELRLHAQIMENMSEGVFLIRASDAVIVYANPRFNEMFGYGPGELSGKHVSVVNAPGGKTPEETAAEINNALRRDGVWRGEVLNVKKSGEPFWCAVRVSTFHSRQYGEVWVAVHTDITSRKWAEEALAESERNYRTIANFTNDWETWLTPNGWLRYVSPSCERITGYPPEKYIADPAFMMSIIHPLDHEMYQGHLDGCHNAQTALAGPDGASEHLRFRIVRKDRAVRWIEHICQSVFDETGQWLGRRASNRDITERVEAQEAMRHARQQAEAATKLKDKFVSLVAHDLRSPLSSVTGLLKAAMNDPAVRGSVRLSEILGMVAQSGDNMLTFIDDLLNISRLQTGSITCRPMTFNARGLAMESLNILSHLAETKGLTLRNEVPEGISIHADLTLIGEALRNLISNAIKFTPKGGVVTVGAEESNSHVTLAVRDTGVGVEPSLSGNLFSHEVRTSTRGTMGERGTGLGLPYSSDIVTAHGGELSFESEPGKGSVFRITLPRE